MTVTVSGDTSAYFVAPAHDKGTYAGVLIASGVAYNFNLRYGATSNRRKSNGFSAQWLGGWGSWRY